MDHLHALVIDDNTPNIKVLTQLLLKEGVTCTEISRPERVPDLLPTLSSLDVVFVDLKMPGLNGYDVKDLLRSRLGDIPIIAYTVHVNDINRLREAGFDGLLGKPLDNTRFADQLTRILKRESVWERN